MSPKVRLDLMVSDSTKQFLQEFAREQGVSMSEMVDQLIIEHLMHMPIEDPTTPDISGAVFDMLKIQELQERATAAIAEGNVWPFEDFCMLGMDNFEQMESVSKGIIYLPTDSPFYGIIVGGCQVDELHNDVIDTYGGDNHPSLLRSVDVYFEWYEDEDGYHPHGLCIVPKGEDPTKADPESDWEAPATWPKGTPEPWNG